MANTVMKIVLLCYWAAYALAFRRRFQSRITNRLALGAGTIVLLQWFLWLCLEVYDEMCNAWPMTIGGKPNWPWYHNHPVWEPLAEVLAYIFLALQVLMLPSLVHLVIRMRQVSRASRSST